MRMIIGLAFLLFSPLLSYAQGLETRPNEPGGATILLNNSLDAIPGPGCINVYPGADGQIITDSTAPYSRANVLRQRKDPTTGIGGLVLSCRFGGVDRMYAAMWFKSNPDFYGVYSNQNKLIGYFSQAHGNFFRMDILKYGDGSLHVRAGFNGLNRAGTGQGNNCHVAGVISVWNECDGVAYFLVSNVNDAEISRGQWHRLEVIAELGTCATCRNGIVRWWIDGVLRGNYTNFNHALSKFVSWELTHTWDGGGCPGGQQNCTPPAPPYSTTDFWYLDHLYLSTFGSKSGPADNPPGAPASVTGVRVTVQ